MRTSPDQAKREHQPHFVARRRYRDLQQSPLGQEKQNRKQHAGRHDPTDGLQSNWVNLFGDLARYKHEERKIDGNNQR